MDKIMHRCKYYPEKSNPNSNGQLCRSCRHLTEFIHCDCFSFEENVDCYKKFDIIDFEFYTLKNMKFLSEESLKKLWDNLEEDKAWEDL